jgi:hypothetical protein
VSKIALVVSGAFTTGKRTGPTKRWVGTSQGFGGTQTSICGPSTDPMNSQVAS